MSKYNLGLVEIINPRFHGSGYYNNNWLNTQYLTYESNINIEDFYCDILKEDVNLLNTQINTNMLRYELNNNKEMDHPCIRNYKKIVSKLNFINLEIIETKSVIYPQDETNEIIHVSILKTFWIRILQRKWKKYYKNKIKFMRNIKNLYYREIHGKYPSFNVF